MDVGLADSGVVLLYDFDLPNWTIACEMAIMLMGHQNIYIFSRGNASFQVQLLNSFRWQCMLVLLIAVWKFSGHFC